MADYRKEISKLEVGLRERNMEYRVRELFGGFQLIAADGWDVICHEYSYGGERGLLEVMGLYKCDGDVIGNLTAEEVLAMVDEEMGV